MSIEIIKGDLLTAPEQYIVHQCNCISAGKGSGAGLAKAIFEKFPHANIYDNRKTPDVPGTILVKGNGKDQRYVIAIFGQYYPGGPQFKGTDTYSNRLSYFTEALGYISCIPNLESIAFPFYIGCGLAAGKWEDYEDMIRVFNHVCKNKVQITIYNNEK